MILLTDATGVNPAVKLALPQEAEEKVTPLAETKARKKVAKNVKQGIFNLLYIYIGVKDFCAKGVGELVGEVLSPDSGGWTFRRPTWG